MVRSFFSCCISILLLLGFGVTTKAQTILPATSLRIISSVAPGSSGLSQEVEPDSVYAFFASGTMQFTCMIKLADTTGIASIQVKLGTTDGGNELTQKTFVFDGPASLPDGTTYLRKGNTLWLGIGTFTGVVHYFGEVRLADALGTLTTAAKTSR